MMTSDETSNPNFCRLANITCKTLDKGQQEKSRISYRCRDKETADRQSIFLRNSLSTVSLLRQRHDILDFACCPLSGVLHVTLANLQKIGFELLS